MYQQFFVMFAMIFTGYFLRKIGFIREEMNNSLNKFIVYCAYPLMLTYNIATMDMSMSLLKEFLLMMAITACIFAVNSLYVRIYSKIRRFPDRASNVAELSMVCPNNGFMGFPMGLSILGPEGLLLMMAQNSTMNVYFFTYTTHVLRRNNENRPEKTFASFVSATVKVLLNPNILAMFVGFFFCFAHIPLDNGVGVYMNYIGGAATPMAMIFIGSTLAGSNFFELLRNHIVWETALNKLIILPFAAAAVMWLLPVPPALKIITVLGLSFPTAATVPMLAEQEGQNHELASKMLFFNNVVSMVTVPMTITLIQALFM